MQSATPTVPAYMDRMLKNFDHSLSFEFRGNHWCILDESKVLNVVKETIAQGYVVRDGKRIRVEISRPVVRHDVVMHLPPDRRLSSSIIDELNYRRMDRWGRKKDFFNHMESEMEKGDNAKRREVDDFAVDTALELNTLRGSPESVVIDGRRE